MQRPLGVFGGTFDPVHFGHLRPALEVLETLQLAELRLVPGRVPPHRETPGATAQSRLEMLQLGVGDQPRFTIDEREMRREGPSYSVDTLRSLRAELGRAQPLCLILGMDAFLGLGAWHRWAEIPELAHLVVTHRPGWSMHEASVAGSDHALALLEARRLSSPQGLCESPAGGIWLQPVSQLAISATDIRRRCREGLSIRYLLPEPVRHYIEQNRLYRPSPDDRTKGQKR